VGSPGNRTLLVISPWDRLWSLGGGAGVSDEYHFIDGFTRAGYDIHFLMPESDEPVRHDFPRLHLHTFPNFFASMHEFPTAVKRLTWMPLFSAMTVPRALRLARETGADAVLCLSYYATLAGWACARRFGIPSVGKLFGVMDLVHTEWPALKYHLKNAEQIAGMSVSQEAWIILDDGTRGDEVARARGIPPERIHFLPNGVNVEWQDRVVDRSAARVRFAIPPDAGVVLFLARLVASKRPAEVIRAAALVLERGPGDTMFVFAGDGPERGACEALARELGVSERIRFIGAVAHDDVPELMAASDLFVSTSNLTNKALPTCEALVCGLPVVAYDVGDTAAVVRPGETGALVGNGDTAGLADAISDLLTDSAARTRLAQAARRVAGQSFTGWDERVAMELEIFDHLIRDRA
jgi:glycosyltransferase involved in cell wall biosynthesis